MKLYRSLIQSSQSLKNLRYFQTQAKSFQIQNTNNINLGDLSTNTPASVDIAKRLDELIPEYHQIGTHQLHRSPYQSQTYQSSYELTMAQMLEAGLHLGSNAEILNQKNLPYIYGTRAGISIFNLELTLAHLKRACGVVKDVSRAGGIILFLSHIPQLASSTVDAAKRARAYYQYTRWVPGTITNRDAVLQHSQFNERDPDQVELDAGGKYFHTPDLLVVMNYASSKRAIAEATKANIPTISIVDSDMDPTGVTYPIPGNDDSIRALELVLGVLSKAGEDGFRLREMDKKKIEEEKMKRTKDKLQEKKQKEIEAVASGLNPEDLQN